MPSSLLLDSILAKGGDVEMRGILVERMLHSRNAESRLEDLANQGLVSSSFLNNISYLLGGIGASAAQTALMILY